MTLHVIATGGTFDKHYDEIAGKLTFGAGHLRAAIDRSRMTIDVVLQELPFLDSLDMHDADRERILAACQRCAASGIVIIHGTDTMRETAELLGRAAIPATIIITGAMIPYEIANSDALFNFGFACGAAQTLPHGVYVAMNGRLFDWDKVQKNRTAGVFEEPN
ncbi:L-asparaginase [Actimicrobium sp. GrIS 1.19]|uniref:asparaginase domain-containing protein n=1 Tax=Actimicrobium sp. GrIS 1.19 TaxID=3071708 RepID=UPI002DF97948|nr:L-asparaginase [Actimicrobium sp. GrIS 1.19]